VGGRSRRPRSGAEPDTTGGSTVRIGVRSEVKAHEYRVAATPDGVRALVAGGHEVTVQRGAGEGSSFEDAAYAEAGATLGSAAGLDHTSVETLLTVPESSLSGRRAPSRRVRP
jgi:alanine dehydrogenase